MYYFLSYFYYFIFFYSYWISNKGCAKGKSCEYASIGSIGCVAIIKSKGCFKLGKKSKARAQAPLLVIALWPSAYLCFGVLIYSLILIEKEGEIKGVLFYYFIFTFFASSLNNYFESHSRDKISTKAFSFSFYYIE